MSMKEYTDMSMGALGLSANSVLAQYKLNTNSLLTQY